MEPVIGILTQPVRDSVKSKFPFDEYILEVNHQFMGLHGAKTIPIRYNLPEKDLLHLLDSINGVLFTGGGLKLINETTGE